MIRINVPSPTHPGNDEKSLMAASGRDTADRSSSNREGRYNLYMMNADGSELERITPNDANHTSSAWSP